MHSAVLAYIKKIKIKMQKEQYYLHFLAVTILCSGEDTFHPQIYLFSLSLPVLLTGCSLPPLGYWQSSSSQPNLICCLRNVLHIIWNWRNCCRFVLVQHWDKCLVLESFSFSTPLSSSQLSSQWSKVCFCNCLSCQCVCFVLPCPFSEEDNIKVNPDKQREKKKETLW